KRQGSGRIGEEQRRSKARQGCKLREERSREGKSQPRKRRPSECHGRSESVHKPSAAQVRFNVKLSGDQSANGAGHGQRAQSESGGGEGGRPGTKLMEGFAREYQRSGTRLQPDPRRRIGKGIRCRLTWARLLSVPLRRIDFAA